MYDGSVYECVRAMGDYIYIAIFLCVMFFLWRKFSSSRMSRTSETAYVQGVSSADVVVRKRGRFAASKFEYALNAEILNTYHVLHSNLQAVNDCGVCDA